MSLQSDLDDRILGINARIQTIRDQAQAAIDALQAQRAVLVEANKALTPQVEAAIASLQRLGILAN